MYDAESDQTDTAQRELGEGISKLAFNIVDTAGLLEQLKVASKYISDHLGDLTTGADRVGSAVAGMANRLGEIDATTTQSLERTRETIGDLQASSAKAREVAQWVSGLHARIKPLEDSLKQVRQSTDRISDIATEVNILAINARIEAARAGEEGRGFAVVAESIGQLAKQTEEVTKSISSEVVTFSRSVGSIRDEAQSMTSRAEEAIETSSRTDDALSAISEDMAAASEQINDIAGEAQVAGDENARFAPILRDITDRVAENVAVIEVGDRQTQLAADTVERVAQKTVSAGIPTEDTQMIQRVTEAAGQIAHLFEDAINSGRITLDNLFDTKYTPIPGSDPQQVTTRFTDLTDALLPPIQEEMLASDPRVVFCAAVDRNGYLPTHNQKFSQPQSADPVWNAANCRNRRIFDDRVGLKSGQSEAPFLLQVYRRDMGGGNTVMMKDLSAPITVQGRHWGGLRLAYKPS